MIEKDARSLSSEAYCTVGELSKPRREKSEQELQLCPTKEHEVWNRIRIVAQPLICNVTLKNTVKILLLQFRYLKK